MESLKILFFLENQYLQTGIETVLDKTRNGFISRELLNMRRELKFPVYEQNGTYYLQKAEEIIGPGEAELRKLQDGDFFSVKDTECPVSGFSRAIFKCRDEKVSFAVRSGTTDRTGR